MRDILLFLIDDWIVFFLACVFELSGDGTGGPLPFCFDIVGKKEETGMRHLGS